MLHIVYFQHYRERDVAQAVEHLTSCKGLNHPIDPTNRMHLQVWIFSNATRDPHVCAVLSVGKCIQKVLCSLSERLSYVATGFPLKKHSNVPRWFYI